MSKSDTVKFNVGGKHFEVSRTLIFQNGDSSMLTRLALQKYADEAPANSYGDVDDHSADQQQQVQPPPPQPQQQQQQQQRQQQQSQPIFIDRNGDVFSLVLDYLRHGNVILPMTIPYETFLRELDHYGIHHEEGTIERDSSCYEAVIVAQTTASARSIISPSLLLSTTTPSCELQVAEHHEKINHLLAQTLSLEKANKLEQLANYCFRKYLQDYKQGLTIFPIYIILDHPSNTVNGAKTLDMGDLGVGTGYGSGTAGTAAAADTLSEPIATTKTTTIGVEHDADDEIFEAASLLNDDGNFEVLQSCLLKYRLRLQEPKKNDLQKERVFLRLWTL